MHHIQRKILEKLLYADSLSYADIRPKGIESNHFAYHLEQLLKNGLVQKQGKHYSLSLQGLATVDRLSQAAMTERLQPHITTAIDITNQHGQTVLFKRNFQPYIHRFSFPLGKTHYDEDIMAAAQRELYEKTGLEHIRLQQRGIVYIQASRNGTAITKKLCHIFQGSVQGTPSVRSIVSYRGEALWADHTQLTKQQVMPGFFAIKELLEREQTFFFSELREES